MLMATGLVLVSRPFQWTELRNTSLEEMIQHEPMLLLFCSILQYIKCLLFKEYYIILRNIITNNIITNNMITKNRLRFLCNSFHP